MVIKRCESGSYTTVVNAARAQTDFDKAYNNQTAKWRYSVTKTTLTLGKMRMINCHNGWPQQGAAYGEHFIKDFYYQIAKGGQGEESNKNDL